ncbi:leucine--tRNA ligase [Candidatus Woesearchaeota archaeon]|nr:leucine--tRNA ligase [Candidatus Woesearchaeota archaeon]
MDFRKICNRWQRRWRTEKVFESEPDNRPKFFLTIPYPYVNGYPHIGHLYTFMRGEATARFKRMQGFNVLFPQGFHATGSPVYAAARRVQEREEGQIKTLKMVGFTDEDIPNFEDPSHWIKIFSQAWEKDLADMGFSYDWRRTFVTTELNPRYCKFIQWQFRRLKKLGLIEKGRHPVVWSKKLGLPVGDHDRAEGEGETPQEMVLVKFKMGDIVLPMATFRPETTYGVTNIWVNPEIDYVEIKINGEKWIVAKECAEKLEMQKRSPEILRELKGAELVGKTCFNPVTNDTVPILPASFVTSDVGTAVVMSVPAHAPYDYMALVDIQKDPAKYHVKESLVKDIEPVGLITVKGYGKWPAKEICEKMKISSQDDPKLEEATNEIYKKEFHTGKLNERTGKYKGLSISEAKEKLIEDFKKEGKADVMWELINPVISRALDRCVVKIVDNQWFIKYGDQDWKQKTMKALQECKLYPEKLRAQFEYVIDWLRDWACTREYGLGTKLPWDTQWVIESLSDSTIYMAFYTISHLLKKITLGNIDDKLFDYVLLGEGSPEEINVEKDLLNQMRNEFKYWYPVDLRNSGKDLVQNHLCFFLFNHVAIFPEKYWPRAIGVNGYVNIQKQKMSKSKGLFLTLRQCIAEFGVDPTRITILSSGEELNDVDWDPDVAKTMQNRLSSLYDFCIDNYSKTIEDAPLKAVDKWMEHMLNICIRDCTQAMENTLFRTALMKGYFDLQRHIKWYMKRTANKPNPKVLAKVIEVQVKLLAPFTPHICEEIWEKLGNKELVSFAEWPEVDENKINPAIEISERVMCQVIDDVGHVKKLAKLDTLNEVYLFVADEWKFQFIKKLHELLENTRNIGEIMKGILPHFKDRSKEVSQLVPKFVKDPSKIPEAVTNAESELQFLLDSKEFFEKEFNCSVNITKESDSKEEKAKSAMPGKPAILVK